MTGKKLWFLVFLIAFIPRMFLLKTSFWTLPDALEYINVAKNFALGSGFTTSIKIHHFENGPIIRSALGTKPPLFSLFIAPFYKLSPDPYFLQFINLTLGAVSIVIFFYFCQIFLSLEYSFIASLLLALNPDYLINNRLLVTEPLFLSLSLLALFFALNKKAHIILAALFCILAYLTRIEGLIIAPVIGIYLFPKNKTNFKKFTAFFLVFLFPYLLLNFLVNKSPFANVGNYHFQTLNFLTSVFYQYGQVTPGITQFIAANFWQIVERIISITILLIKTLIRPSNIGLLFLLIFLRKPNKKIYPLMAIILINFLVLISTWGLVIDPTRYLILIDTLLIFWAIFNITKLKPKLNFILITLCFLFYLVFDVHRINWARTQIDQNWDSPNVNQSMQIILNNTNNNDVIAAPNPGLINIKTDRPAVVLPSNLSSSLLEQFINDYQPKIFFINESDSQTLQTLKQSNLKKIIINPYYLFIR